MANVGFIIGTGSIGEDSLKINQLIKNISNHNFYIASRIDKKVHLNGILEDYVGEKAFNDIKENIDDLNQHVQKFYVVYESPYLKEKYTDSDINKLQKWIGISFDFFSSMDRRFYDRKKISDIRDNHELNNYIAGLINFFKDFFLRNNINIFINTVEDDVFSLAAYFVAKKLDVSIIGFMPGRFPINGNMFCKNFNSIYLWNELKSVEWSRIKSLYTDNTIAQKDLQDRNKNLLKINFSIITRNIRMYLNYRRYCDYIFEVYPYEKFIFEKINPWTEIKKSLKKIIRYKLFRFIVSEHNMKRDDYFLFPIHFVDDAQITFREPLMDQVEIIKKIVRSLPSGYQLYVKPHPHYLGTDISLSDFFELSKLKNLKIIDPSSPPIKLIKNSKGVITFNSTTGFEALIHDVPVITLGHDFYCKEELCFVVRDINELPSKLLESQIRKKDRYEIKEFVKKVYLNTIWVDRLGYTYNTCGLLKEDGEKLASSLNIILDNE